MSHPELVENVAAGLAQRGLPSEYVERVQAELADHYADLVEDSADTAEAAERLGDERRLTKRFVREYQRRSFAGRFPLVTFLLGAPAALALTWTAVYGVLYAIVECVPGYPKQPADGLLSWLEWTSLWSLFLVFVVVLPALIAVWFSQRARRAGLQWPWAVTSCVLMAFVAGAWNLRIDYEGCRVLCSVPFPIEGPGTGPSWPVYFATWFFATPSQIMQWTPVLLLGLFAYWQSRFATWRGAVLATEA